MNNVWDQILFFKDPVTYQHNRAVTLSNFIGQEILQSDLRVVSVCCYASKQCSFISLLIDGTVRIYCCM